MKDKGKKMKDSPGRESALSVHEAVVGLVKKLHWKHASWCSFLWVCILVHFSVVVTNCLRLGNLNSRDLFSSRFQRPRSQEHVAGTIEGFLFIGVVQGRGFTFITEPSLYNPTYWACQWSVNGFGRALSNHLSKVLPFSIAVLVNFCGTQITAASIKLLSHWNSWGSGSTQVDPFCRGDSPLWVQWWRTRDTMGIQRAPC